MQFTLEPWKAEYISDIVKYANNIKIAINLRDGFPYPYTFKDAERYIASCIKREGRDCLTRAILIDGEAVGSIGVFKGEDVSRISAEMGYWLGEPFWNKGIMTEAIMRLCHEAFSIMDIVRIFAKPFSYNKGSVRALEKAGFTLEGVMRKSVIKNGVIYDSLLYAIIKE